MAETRFDALAVLEIGKEVERRGQAFYQEAAQIVADSRVKTMLLVLADDELRHLQILETMGRRLQEAFPAFSSQEDVNKLATRFKEVLFPDEPVIEMSATGKTGEIQALERGIQLEEESIKLYEGAAEGDPSPGTGNAFRRLVMEERIHWYILTRRLDLLKFRT